MEVNLAVETVDEIKARAATACRVSVDDLSIDLVPSTSGKPQHGPNGAPLGCDADDDCATTTLEDGGIADLNTILIKASLTASPTATPHTQLWVEQVIQHLWSSEHFLCSACI